MASVQGTKVITNIARVSYANLMTPKMNDQGQPKYGCAILIPKSDVETVNAINAAVEAAKQAGVTSKYGGQIPYNLKTPLRDGDLEKPNDAVYTGMYFFNASSNTKPQIIDVYKNAIEDPAQVYSGMWARFSINFYPYANSGNKGVAAGLENVQKLQDGEPLSGGASAEDDFNDDYALNYAQSQPMPQAPAAPQQPQAPAYPQQPQQPQAPAYPQQPQAPTHVPYPGYDPKLGY